MTTQDGQQAGQQPDRQRGVAYDAHGRPLDQIRLSGITATGYHGVFEHERREGQTFVADVVVHLDTRRAAARDDLAHTLDYGDLATKVAAVLSGEPVDLVETVAERIAATVLAFAIVQAVDVAVHKPQAPITVPFGDVVVAIHRDRTKLPAAEPYEAPAQQQVRPKAYPAAGHPSERAAGRPGAARSGPAQTAPLPVTGALTGAAGGVGAGAGAVAGQVTVSPAPAAALPDGVVSTPWSAPPTPQGTLPPAAQIGPGPASPQDAVVVGEIVTDELDEPPAGPVDVVLAIGANLGNAQETLRRAVSDLAAVPGLEVVDVSPLARTAPVGGPEQPDFLNAVVLARTVLAARDLLRATQGVEQAHGRERHEHWGPRTLDVDIVVYGTVLATSDDLELPHPRAHERAFVLEPWAQVDPHAVLPGLGGGPVAALAATAPDREGVRWLALDWLTVAVPAANPAPESADVPPVA